MFDGNFPLGEAPGRAGRFSQSDWKEVLRERLSLGVVSPSRLIAIAVGLLVLAAGAYFLLRPAPAPVVVPRALPVSVTSSSAAEVAEESTGASSSSGPEILVHAAGAVRNPGVYRFLGEARVVDLMYAAGGAIAETDLGRVNLASPLSDGVRVFFPFAGEEPPRVITGGEVGKEMKQEASGPIDLNSASVAALQQLPGVGPVTAAAIVEYRSEHGLFTSVEGLLEVGGIGPAKLEQLSSHVVVLP